MMNRRSFLANTGLVTTGLILGCRPQDKKSALPLTEDNIEGPFFRKNAPFRDKLAEGAKGDLLKISGKVFAQDGTPLKDAIVEVWQADKAGAYDNTSDKFVLRGRLKAGREGVYAYETIMPGQYDMGESKRPAHIHYKIHAEGHKSLTTQLYFKGDKYLDKDPFVRKSLIIEVKDAAGTFDIVLAKA